MNGVVHAYRRPDGRRDVANSSCPCRQGIPAMMSILQAVRNTNAFLPCQLLCRKKTLLTDQSLKSFSYRFSLRLSFSLLWCFGYTASRWRRVATPFPVMLVEGGSLPRSLTPDQGDWLAGFCTATSWKQSSISTTLLQLPRIVALRKTCPRLCYPG